MIIIGGGICIGNQLLKGLEENLIMSIVNGQRYWISPKSIGSSRVMSSRSLQFNWESVPRINSLVATYFVFNVHSTFCILQSFRCVDLSNPHNFSFNYWFLEIIFLTSANNELMKYTSEQSPMSTWIETITTTKKKQLYCFILNHFHRSQNAGANNRFHFKNVICLTNISNSIHFTFFATEQLTFYRRQDPPKYGQQTNVTEEH